MSWRWTRLVLGRPASRRVLALTVLAAAVSLPWLGCSKEKESLILVTLIADSNAGNLRKMTLSAEGTVKNYDIPAGLSASGMTFGMWVPSGVDGSVDVNASARPTSDCTMGYAGQGRTMPFKVGETTTVSIMLKAADVCGTGGTGGMGGAGGGGGNNGCTGVQPPAGTPPTLRCCTEYDHTLLDTACDDNNTYMYGVAFSPDGRYVVSSGDDGRYVFWNFDGSRLTAEGHNISGGVYGYAAFSPDSTKLAAGGGDVHLFGVGDWTDLGSLTIDYISYGVGFSPDNVRVIDIDSDSIYIHSIADQTQVAKAPLPQSAWAMAISPAIVGGGLGVAVPSGSSGFATVYNLPDPSTIGTPIVLDLGLTPIWSAAFSPDGTRLAIGGYDSFVRIWTTPLTAATDAPIASFSVDVPSMSEDVQALAFSPNGNYLAVASGFSGGHASIWDLRTMTKVSSVALPTRFPMSIAFAPAGNAIAVGEHGCGKFLLCTE